MRLKAVEEDEEDVREEDVARWLAEGTDGDGEGNADVVDQRVEEQSGQCGAEVEVERGDAPINGFAVDGVVDEAAEFGPGGDVLPEVGVDGEGDGESEYEAEEAGGDDILKRVERDAALDEEVESMTAEKEGEFRAEDDAGDGKYDNGSPVELYT